MVANLPPEYYALLEELKSAKKPEDKIRILKQMLSVVPKHKDSQMVIGEIKRKISKLKEEVQKKKKARKEKGIKKEGIQIALLGFENSGKTTFLNKFCNKNEPASLIPFETQRPNLGVYKFRDVNFQIVDLPSIPLCFEGISLGVLKSCDLILIFLRKGDEFDEIKKLLEEYKIELGKEPKIKIEKQSRGGIEIIGDIEGKREDFVNLLIKHKIYNGIVRVYSPLTLNKFEKFLEGYVWKEYEIFGENIFEKIYQKLDLKRIYTKTGKKIAEKPIVFRGEVKVRDVAERIHKDFVKRFKWAKVKGKSVKYDWERVGLDHKLEDGDIIEIKID